MSINKLCAYAGCNELVPLGISYCDKHKHIGEQRKTERNKRYDKDIRFKRDQEYTLFYRSNEWKDTQAFVMDKYNGLCLWLLYIDNEIVTADEVHHIEPIKKRFDLRFKTDNLIPLSHGVHMMVEKLTRAGDKNIQARLRELKDRWDREHK